MNYWTSKISISPNGKYIASNHQEELKVWDLKGNLIYEKKWDNGIQVKLIGFSSDDEILIHETNLKRIKFQNQEINEVFGIPQQYSKVVVDISRELIAGITEQGNLALFDWNGSLLDEVFKIDNERMYYSLLFHPKHLSFLIITGKYLEPMKFWDLRGHQIIKPLRKHTGRISSVSFASNSQYIVSAGQNIYYPEDRRSEDKALYLWDTSGNLIGTFSHDFGVSSVALSKNNQLIASFDGSIWLWDFEGKLIHKFPGVIKGIEIRDAAIAFNQDNQNIVVAELNGGVTITVWDQQGNLISQSFQDHGRAAVTSVAISPNSEFILVGGDWTRIVNRDASPVAEFRGGHREPHTRIMSVAFSPDGCHAVTGGYDHTVQLWRCDGIPNGSAFAGHQNVVSAVVFSPDGNYIASGDWNGVIRLWDLQGNPIGEFQGHEGAVNALTFSLDGYTLVSGGNDGSLRLWRAHWKCWLELACDRLRYHPVFTNPESIEDPGQREIAIAACETCKKYVWNKNETD